MRRTPVTGKHTSFVGYVAPIPGHENGWWQSWLPDAPPERTIGTHQDEAQAVRFLLQLEQHRQRTV
ncbi:hypothetical protein FHX34_10413 [Actinoplanes teichomyceticus]|uniref:Uncharacterized protein n=2 Tax=Actinoplanes teichomyceticus TaxID=1867 RepID=A0A561VQ28_ACTTI|nr:hypothetical protein FHX34_10413 [Actinoplanes teichomyceticus]